MTGQSIACCSYGSRKTMRSEHLSFHKPNQRICGQRNHNVLVLIALYRLLSLTFSMCSQVSSNRWSYHSRIVRPVLFVHHMVCTLLRETGLILHVFYQSHLHHFDIDHRHVRRNNLIMLATPSSVFLTNLSQEPMSPSQRLVRPRHRMHTWQPQ